MGIFKRRNNRTWGRAPKRWTIWEGLLVVLSSLMILFPLYAEVGRWVNPPLAPAQESDPSNPSDPSQPYPPPPPREPARVTDTPPPESPPTEAPAPAEQPTAPVEEESPPQARVTDTPVATAPPGATDTPTPAPATDTPTPDPNPPTNTPTDPPSGPTNTATPFPTARPTNTPGGATTLSLSKFGNLSRAAPGQVLNFSLAANTSSPTAHSINVQDTLDDNLQLLSASSPQGSCSTSGQSVNCNVTASDGSPAQVVITAKVLESTPGGTTITNVGTCSGNGTSARSNVVVVQVEGDLPITPVTVEPTTAVPATDIPATNTPTSPPNGPTDPPVTQPPDTAVPTAVPTTDPYATATLVPRRPIPNIPTPVTRTPTPPGNGNGDDDNGDDDDDGGDDGGNGGGNGGGGGGGGGDDDGDEPYDDWLGDVTPPAPPPPPPTDAPVPPPPPATEVPPPPPATEVPPPPPTDVPAPQPTAPPVVVRPTSPPVVVPTRSQLNVIPTRPPVVVQPTEPPPPPEPTAIPEPTEVPPTEVPEPTPVPPTPLDDIDLRLTSDWGSAFPGQEVNYTIVLENNRTPEDEDAVLDDVTLRSTLPSNLEVLGATTDVGDDPTVAGNRVEFNLDSFAPGEIIELTVKTRIRDSVPWGTLMVAQGEVEYDSLDRPFLSNIVTLMVLNERQQVATLTATPSPTPTPSDTPTATPTPSDTPTRTPTDPPATPTPTDTPTPISVADTGALPSPVGTDMAQITTGEQPFFPPPRRNTSETLELPPLPDTSTGVPIAGFALLGLTLLTRTIRLHREQERL